MNQSHFPGQKKDERVLHIVRKHWIIDLAVGSILFVFGLVPAIAVIIGIAMTWDGTLSEAHLITILGTSLYLLCALLWTYVHWLGEELDIIIVTNERVISHDQVDLFHRQISETNLAQVQDVKGTEKGLMGHLLHYGQLKIQTAAHRIVFEIKDVAKPYEQARLILEIRDHFIKKHPNSESLTPDAE